MSLAVVLFYIVFVTLLVAANVALHWYLWRRLVTDTQLTGALRGVVGSTIVVLGVLVPINFAVSRVFGRDALFSIPSVVWTWLGVAFYLATYLVTVDTVRIVRRFWKRRRGDVEPAEPAVSGAGMERRVFFSRVLVGSAGVVATSTTAFGLVRANGDFVVPEIEVKLERLPRALEGFRIALLSDIHIGPVLDGRFVDHIVESTNRLKPDLVCMTGDLVDGSIPLIGDEIARFAGLKARHGVAFSTGNHEYYSGVVPWMEFLRKLGFHVLANERISVGDTGPGGASFDLAGIHDLHGTRVHASLGPDLDAALRGRDPDRELVLMAHQPKQIAMAEGKGVGLQLSGHTHGGQVWPFGAAVVLTQPYLQGHHVHDDGTQIYVTCGSGYWGPPLRVGAPPEITTLVLTS